MRTVLPTVSVRISGKVFRLDETIKYLKRNNLYQASMFIVKMTGINKDYATQLAIAIRKYWQEGMDPIQLNCVLVGRSAASARFTVRLDQEAAAQQKAEAEQKAKDEAAEREKAEKQAMFDSLSPEQKYLLRIRKVNEKIEDPEVTAKLNDIDAIVLKIIARIEQKPEARSLIEDFYTEYLPRAVAVSEKYANIYATGITNDDTKALKDDILNSLQTCADAFHNFYERTYDEDMINLSAELAALNSRLNYDGLTKSDFDISE
ncbi:MAG: 5-bromo-4-chloroindolyl phosphate hydrolysis family protein [Firmicutes bacterium]|nr:5-bromo-4-chloroindolyl phosphate hydrolysis family protein [Bacillota bacterium]